MARGTTVGGGRESPTSQRPSVGQSNDTVLFTARWTHASQSHRERLVLRRQATANQIFREPDVIREARVLQGLAAASPRPGTRRALVRDRSRGARGAVLRDDRGAGTRARRATVDPHRRLAANTDDRERERLWASAMETLVAIHDVDWQRSHAFLLDDDRDAATLDAHVDRLADWYAWSTAGREFPVTDAALAFLVEHRSDIRTGSPALVWGDARVGNMIFGDEHTVVAAIDWEVASIGEPAIDVAHWLFFDDFGTHACGIEPLPGWPDRATHSGRYEALAGRTLDDLDFYELMEEFFMATTLIRQADTRVARGLAPPDHAHGPRQHGHPDAGARLRLPVPALSPDYVAHRGRQGALTRERTCVNKRCIAPSVDAGWFYLAPVLAISASIAPVTLPEPRPMLWMLTSTSAASARSAPTVQCSLGRWANGSYWNSRIAFSCVILLIVVVGQVADRLHEDSGACGHAESECG